jgi:NAD(P)-dependent dehydrogenase (short-subunit alcohol dehydrogenase family)
MQTTPEALTAQSVLIFGGTSGINLGIAEAFAKAGARVGVVSRSEDKVAKAKAHLESFGGQVFGACADVRSFDAVQSAVENFSHTFGAIDVLVSGAAGNFPSPASSLSSNGFKAVVDIDLVGTFHVMRASYTHLRKPGASIINISAPQALIPMAMQVHVCAAKAGVDMLTRTLAIEWGPEGLRINSIIPGPIDGTEGMARLAATPEARKAVIESVPMRRMGMPSDIADVCLFLASQAARYVSGAVIPVDGGWAAAGARLPL